jgi:hypothetical protein
MGSKIGSSGDRAIGSSDHWAIDLPLKSRSRAGENSLGRNETAETAPKLIWILTFARLRFGISEKTDDPMARWPDDPILLVSSYNTCIYHVEVSLWTRSQDS